jgi:ABC-type multidrug transport system fused ATPase/permease subunit
MCAFIQMNKSQISINRQIQRLWAHLSQRRRRQLVILYSMIIAASLSEMVSIGAVLPFLSVLIEPEKVYTYEIVQPVIKALGIEKPEDLIFTFTAFFVLAAIASGFSRVFLLWLQTRLSSGIGADFSIQVYERTLHQPYYIHLKRSSSEIIAGSQKAKDLVAYTIQPILLIISSFSILLAVVSILLVIQPVAATTALLGFGVSYFVVVITTKRRIAENGQTIANHQVRVTKAIQEGLGGIRDVLINGTQLAYSKLYRDAVIPMQAANASNQVVATGPRFAVEALGMVLIASLAYWLSSSGKSNHGLNHTVPLLGALALGAQRLLPVLQQIYSAYITLRGHQASAQDALDLLDQPMPDQAKNKSKFPVVFHNNIQLVNLGFRYSPEGPWVLRGVNLVIDKGTTVGFIGVTGSGKSTLLDILMGLLPPTEGDILVDGVPVMTHNMSGWQARIANVPQSIFLFDSSVAENIALGVPVDQIDFDRVKSAANQAKIGETIEHWADGYNTLVGERGLRLSGGQRQRIGIARALYKRADVLVFDEATSALDSDTEQAVMRQIESLGDDMTVLVIAHRLTTLINCDSIVEVSNCKLKPVDRERLVF